MTNATNRHALAAGSEIGQYRIIRELGHGGFGITYLAQDIRLDCYVAIKEYFPNELSMRNASNTVLAKSSNDDDNYIDGMRSFLDEARILAKFRHPNIVRVNNFLEANNTAYIVMDYEEGQNMSQWLRNLDRPPIEDELNNILHPLLDGLEQVHNKGFLHRDIKPGNIIIRKNDSPVLIDFGAARFVVGQKSRSLSAVLSDGYSPAEQYETHGNQGEWSDLYALCATLYRAISGENPARSTDRGMALARRKADPLLATSKVAKGIYNPKFLQAIDAGLSVFEEDRPKNVAEFREVLGKAVIEEPIPQQPIAKATENKTATSHSEEASPPELEIRDPKKATIGQK
ncbi:MAG: serine/threonine-protein kinase, partial [Mariprofundales bacterium]